MVVNLKLKYTNWIIGLILLLGLILRVVTIKTYNIWFDESYSWAAAIRPFKFLFTNPPPDVHPFGLYSIERVYLIITNGFNDPYNLRALWKSVV